MTLHSVQEIAKILMVREHTVLTWIHSFTARL